MRRLLFRLLILLLFAAPVIFAAAALQRTAALPATATLDPRMAVQAKGLASRARAVMVGPAGADGTRRITATEAELNSALAAAARVVRPLRGTNRIDDTGVWIALSAQVPGLPQLGWINAEAHAAPSTDGLNVRSIRLGSMDLPPDWTVAALVGLMDLVSADDVGSALLSGIVGLQTTDGRAELMLAGGPGDGPSLLDKLSGTIRGIAGLGDTDAASGHYAAMSRAADEGALPSSGSALPWVRLAVSRVAAANHGSEAAARADMRAALIALGAHCGDRSIVETVVGALAAPASGSACAATTLGGRRDLRQHFTLSAALAAAGGDGFSFGLGEIKELLDAGERGGSGYSFDDLAFDRAGMRFAARVLEAAPDTLGALAVRLDGEAAIVPAVGDLPARLSEARFVADFGAVDSPAYREMVSLIDARIDALAVHAEDP